MFLVGFPLLLVPFALYNMIAFLLPGVAWTSDIAHIGMMSGADWTLTPGAILVAIAILLLFGELIKATRMSRRSIVDHLLSILLFLGMAAEFLLVGQAATGTFFLLLVTSFVDVAGGFTITIRTGRRARAAESAEPEKAERPEKPQEPQQPAQSEQPQASGATTAS